MVFQGTEGDSRNKDKVGTIRLSMWIVCVCVRVCVCVSSMVEVEEVYNKKGAELSEVVRPIKEVNRKHQQVMCNTVMCVCWKNN